MKLFRNICLITLFSVVLNTGSAELLVNLDFEADTPGQRPEIPNASFSPGSNDATNGAKVIDSGTDPVNPLNGRSLYVYDLSGDLSNGNPTHLRFPFNGGTNRTEVRLQFDFQRAFATPVDDLDTRVHIALGRVGDSLNNSDFRPFELRILNSGELIINSLAGSESLGNYQTDAPNTINILANSHDTNSVAYDLDGLGSGVLAPNTLHLFLNGAKKGEFDFHVTPDPVNAPQMKFNERDDDLGQLAIYQDSKRQGGIVFDNIVLTPINEVFGPPLAPNSLALVANEPFSVEMNWVDASTDETGFIVERREEGQGSFESLAVLATDVTSYIDQTVVPETSYTYRVIADNGFKSTPSNELAVTTPEQLKPLILSFQADTLVLVDQTATFSVDVVGRDPLTFQWYSGESGDVAQPISLANEALFESDSLSANSSFWVRVSNGEGSVDSQTFPVVVREAQTITVGSRSEIENVLLSAGPGDTLVMPNGTYQDLVIKLEGNGTKKAPITLRAERPGGVILTGESRVQIGGQWLVLDGFIFTGPYSGNDDEVIQFRSGGLTTADCRVTQVSLIDYVPVDGTKTSYVSLYGQRNRVDHSYFSGHNVPGVTLLVWLEGMPNYHRIDHNHFANRIDSGGANGWETMRIGDSDTSMQNSRTTVEYNLFNRTDGEIEIISNKSCENIYRYNTFRNCRGTLTLRHGNRCRVEGNYFIGEFAYESGGVRVIGEDHVVINNYFESTTARDGTAITLYPGVPGAALNEYFAAHRAVVAFNTFYNNSGPLIDVSARYGTSGRTILPTGMVIANNLLVAGSQTSGDFLVGLNPGNQTWAGNIIYGRPMVDGLTEGYTVLNPLFEPDESTGIQRISAISPVINAAASAFDDVELDIDGQARIGIADVGADEFSGEPGLTSGPLRESEVGPSYTPSKRPINVSLKIPIGENGWPTLLSETGAFKDLQTLEPETGILHYEPVLSFWSDYAKKTRWFYIPVGTELGYSQNSNWQFPEGSVWIKHFDLELERGNPATAKRIETRFLVKTQYNTYGVSYRWNDSGTEATLVAEDGVSFDLAILEGAEERTQTWSIPSRSDCLTCHTFSGGYALSFNTRQLNHRMEIDGSLQNFLGYLSDHGFLDTELSNPDSLPYFVRPDDTAASLELKVRSYLAVNCVNCHQPGATETDSWDARPFRTLLQTRLIDGKAAVKNDNENLRLVVRGSPEDSALYLHLKADQGLTRMPPLGSNELDLAGIELIRRWITDGLPNYQSFEEWRPAQFGAEKDMLGKAGDDPDHDGDPNDLEFLNQTDPLSPNERSTLLVNETNGSLLLGFPAGNFAQYQIETSVDLDQWKPLQGEDGRMLTLPEGKDTIDLRLQPENVQTPGQFFRLNAKEL